MNRWRRWRAENSIFRAAALVLAVALIFGTIIGGILKGASLDRECADRGGVPLHGVCFDKSAILGRVEVQR